MGDMGPIHDEVPVTDAGTRFPRISPDMDRDVFTNPIIPPNLEAHCLAIPFDVLRRAPHTCMGGNPGPRTNVCDACEHDVGADLHSDTEGDPLSHDGVGSHSDTFVELDAGLKDCGGMNQITQ